MHGCFLPLSWSGATPLKPRFFCLQGSICLFYPKNRIFYYRKAYFYTVFLFFITFLRPLHIRAKVSEVEKILFLWYNE
ncbi:hypothetical protein BREVNS_1882 [Brevinematales bacterium NS]|nr:hypothetical protein BREVNS_1882 [Brevinematales bacterium NS]